MHRNRETAVTEITDDLFFGSPGILSNENDGESGTESLDRTDSVRGIYLGYSERNTTLFFSIFGLAWIPTGQIRAKNLVSQNGNKRRGQKYT